MHSDTISGSSHFQPVPPGRRELIEDFFENCPVCLHIVASDGIILHANRAELDLLGYQTEEYVGRHIAEFHADPEICENILCRLSKGEKLERHPARLRAKDGSVRHVQITSNAQILNGEFVNTRCLTVDVTQAVLAEQRLSQRERQYQRLLDALPAAIYTTDADGRLTYYNRAAEELAGCPPVLYQDMWCVTWRLYGADGTPLARDLCPMAITIRENRPVRGAEVIAERPDGTRVPLLPYPTPLQDDSGQLVGAVNMLIDISERKQAERTRELLIGELNHRVKNSLATVQAIAQQTLRHSPSPERFVMSFTGRIQALARAHTMLAATSWKGADLAALVREQVGAGGDSRVSLSGPAVTLEPQLALHLALVVHELAANARTFGALAKPDGRLRIAWAIETNGGRSLRLEWAESGVGPTPTAQPSGGFGSKLMSQIARSDGGEARITYGPDGVRWDIRLSLPHEPTFEKPGATSVATAPAVGVADAAIPHGRRVLIVEDEPLIALELSEMLTDAGVEVAGLARTVEEAREATRTLVYSAVILDANLRGSKVDEIAASLAERNVPFAFMSGYGRESLPAGFREKLLISKPFTAHQVLNALSLLLSNQSTGPAALESAGNSPAEVSSSSRSSQSPAS